MVQKNGEGRAAAVLFIGFDAAWMDNARAPGAMCAASFDGRRFPHPSRRSLSDLPRRSNSSGRCIAMIDRRF